MADNNNMKNIYIPLFIRYNATKTGRFLIILTLKQYIKTIINYFEGRFIKKSPVLVAL